MFIQEGPYAENVEYRVLDSGHLLFLSECRRHQRSVGVLLHRRWVASVSGYGVGGSRVAFVDLTASVGELRLISAHFPHNSYPDLEYEACMATVEHLIEEAEFFHTVLQRAGRARSGHLHCRAPSPFSTFVPRARFPSFLNANAVFSGSKPGC